MIIMPPLYKKAFLLVVMILLGPLSVFIYISKKSDYNFTTYQKNLQLKKMSFLSWNDRLLLDKNQNETDHHHLKEQKAEQSPINTLTSTNTSNSLGHSMFNEPTESKTQSESESKTQSKSESKSEPKFNDVLPFGSQFSSQLCPIKKTIIITFNEYAS